MSYRLAINGFGRIGRRVARLLLERESRVWQDLELVAVHDFSDPKTLLHLFQYDSIHGRCPLPVNWDTDGQVHLGRHSIQFFSEKDSSRLPWGDLGIDLVLDCTGSYTQREKAQIHRDRGAGKVLISAPAQDPDLTLCFGINQDAYRPDQHHILSSASCTTNCLVPLLQVIEESWGVDNASFLTVHSYTQDQALLDAKHKDLRRARAAGLSQVPTSTGAAQSVGLLFPHLIGKIIGGAIRVPTPNVSLVDLTVRLKNTVSDRQEVNAAFYKASRGVLTGVLDYSEEPLVSEDYNGSLASATLDSLLTDCILPQVAKVTAWYDNETGFSARMLDTAAYLARHQSSQH